MLVLVPHGGAN